MTPTMHLRISGPRLGTNLIAAVSVLAVGCATGTPWIGTPPVLVTAASFEQFADIADADLGGVQAAADDCRAIEQTCSAAAPYCSSVRTELSNAAPLSTRVETARDEVSGTQSALAVVDQFDPAFALLDLNGNPGLRAAVARVEAAADNLEATGFRTLYDGALGGQDRDAFYGARVSPADIGYYATALLNALLDLEDVLAPVRAELRRTNVELDDIRDRYLVTRIGMSIPPDAGYVLPAVNDIGFGLRDMGNGLEDLERITFSYLTDPWAADFPGANEPISELTDNGRDLPPPLIRMFSSVNTLLGTRNILRSTIDDAASVRQTVTGSDSTFVQTNGARIQNAADDMARLADDAERARGEAQRNLVLAARACGVETPAELSELPLETPFDEWIDIPAASNTFWDWSSP